MPEYHMNTAGEVPVDSFADGRYAPSTAPEDTHSFADLDAFTQAYIEAMFWTSEAPGVSTEEWQATEDHDEGSIPGDVGFGDIAPQALASIMADCAAFQALPSWQAAMADEACEGDESQGGHDFWLTRNRHGAGFWDRGNGVWPDKGKALTDDAHAFGEVDCYLGGDGKVYV